MARKQDDNSQLFKQLATFGAIPMLLAFGPLIGYLIGNWLDEWLGTKPFLMVAFIVLGFVASGKEVYNLVRRVSKDL